MISYLILVYVKIILGRYFKFCRSRQQVYGKINHYYNYLSYLNNLYLENFSEWITYEILVVFENVNEISHEISSKNIQFRRNNLKAPKEIIFDRKTYCYRHSIYFCILFSFWISRKYVSHNLQNNTSICKTSWSSITGNEFRYSAGLSCKIKRSIHFIKKIYSCSKSIYGAAFLLRYMLRKYPKPVND